MSCTSKNYVNNLRLKFSIISCNAIRTDFFNYIFFYAITVNNTLMFADASAYNQASNDTVHLIPEIGLLDKLQSVDLRANFINGTLPTHIGLLSYLQHLNLYGNSISGSIPTEICRISGLRHLILGRNAMSGTIMTCFGSLKHLNTLHLGYNDFSGDIPSEMGLMNKLGEYDI